MPSKKGIILLLILCFLHSHGFTQVTPIIGFTIPDTVCVNAPVTINNTSIGGSSFYWNFCLADISSTPVGTNLGNIDGELSQPVFMDIVSDNNQYYGFLTNHFPGSLIRLDFGNSLLNTPTAANLGNFGGIIPPGYGTEGIQVVHNEGNWYAIIVGGYPPSGSTPRILKIDFGANLNNLAPVATDWGNLGNMLQPLDLHVFQENNNWYGLTVNAENSTITRFNFTNSFNNTPTAVNLGNIGGLVYPTGIYAINDNGNWHVFVTNGTDNSSISRLDFGNSLLNTPTGVNLGDINGAMKRPRDVYMLKFCDSIMGFVVNDAGNDIVQLSFNNDILSTPTAASFGNIGGFSIPHSISKIFRVGSDLFSFVTNVGNNSITRIQFAGCQSSSIANSIDSIPPAISYTAPGTYRINLMMDEGLATQSSFCKSIVVLPAPEKKPPLDTSMCIGDSIVLKAYFRMGNYLWSTGSTADSICVKTAGAFWVQYNNYGCIGIDSFNTSLNSLPLITLGNDTAICQNDSLILDAGANGTSYTWQNNSTGRTLVLNSQGTYTVKVTDQLGCTNIDSVRVTTLALPLISLSNDTTICPGTQIQLSASGGISYDWFPTTGLSNPGISTPIAIPVSTTTYKVIVTGPMGCYSSDSVLITLPPSSIFAVSPADTNICIGSSAMLAASGGNIYQWSPLGTVMNATSASVLVSPLKNTTYKVVITDTICQKTDSLFVPVNLMSLPNTSIAKSNDVNCILGQVQLRAAGGINYHWEPANALSDPNSAFPIANPSVTTTYTVSISDINGCAAKDSIIVNVSKGDPANGYLLPNAFTPNGDGINDCFGVQKWGMVQKLELFIYDRWDKLIFYTKDASRCWDGTYHGKSQPAGTYIYQIKAEAICGSIFRKGTVTLLK